MTLDNDNGLVESGPEGSGKRSGSWLAPAATAAWRVGVLAGFAVTAILLIGLQSTEVMVLNPVEEVTVANPVTDVAVLNPVDEVTVLNPVDEVSVLNPVEEVTVLNPVTEVEVTNPVRSVSVRGSVSVSEIESLVQTAIPWDEAELYGRCNLRGSQYDLSIKALAGGVEHVVAEGRYSGDIASLIGEYVAEYYYGFRLLGLDFGDSSKDCSGLEGWG